MGKEGTRVKWKMGNRANRGGSWFNLDWNFCVTYRDRDVPFLSCDHLGFRLVMIEMD